MRLLTRDLYEGAYLLSQGMELKEIWADGQNGKRAVVFEFAGENAEILRKGYQLGHAEVNILKLKSSLNELKDRMFSLLRSAECGSVIRENEIEKGGNHEPIYRTRAIGIKTASSY